MSASNNAAAAAPWADLLPELCNLVVDRLDAIGILRFPAACAGWATACKDNHPLLRSGSPALLTSGLDAEGVETEHDVDAGVFALHNFSSTTSGGRRSSFLGDSAGLKGRTWIGGKDDWLVTTDYLCNVELLNPVTGDQVPLPSFETTQGVEVKLPGDYLHVSVQDRWHRFLKVTLCQTPAHPSGYLAISLFSHGLLAYTAAGDKCWTAFKNEPLDSRSLQLSYMDAIVLKEKLFAVTESGGIYCWDMTSRGSTKPPARVQGPEEMEMSHHCYGRGFYLAASSDDRQLMLIYVYGDTNTFELKDNRVYSRLVFNDRWSFCEYGTSIHELDAGSGAWRRVADLGGDRSLFLGANYPFYVDALPGSEDLKADCVYVADTPSGYDVGIFDLNKGEDGLVERVTSSLMADPLQMPMWFRPTTHPRLLK
ncbi:unnamed protein product [Urochloa humidicola]